MNKQSLYLFGGALLATTSLSSTGSQAAIIVKGENYVGAVAPTSFTAYPLAAEVFSATAATANALTISGTNSANAIILDFLATLTGGFQVQINVTNAAFTGTPTVATFAQDTSGTLTASSVTGCSVQSLPDKLLITSCTAQGSGLASRADALAISGLTYISGAALATAGTSIKLDGNIKDSAGSITFEMITSVNVITSRSAGEVAIQTPSTVTIDNNATPVFSKFTNGTATATVGSIHFSSTASVGRDLVTTFSAAAEISGNAEVKVAHGALTDLAGLLSITVAGNPKSPGTFVSGTVSFQITPASLNGAAINVTFDGTAGINATTGSPAVTVTPTTVGTIVRAISAFSGNLAALSRGGLSVELNSLFNTAAGEKYRSILRISNASPIDGVATLTVKNDVTGASIGSFTTTVTAGATRQISSTDIETAITTALAAGAPYKVIVSGSFNGYVQHLLWNSVTGLFTDLSGFRNGALTVDP